MQGQMTIFDIHNGKRMPYDYRCMRYIGQKVHLMAAPDKIFTVKKIEPYYTIVTDDENGEECVGTPTTMWPEDKNEKEN